MKKKEFTREQSTTMLRELEVLLSQGATAADVVRKLGITEQTYYRWRREYGGMRVEQAKRLKELEQENTRIKKLVADLPLDNAILKEAARSYSGFRCTLRFRTTAMRGPGAVPVDAAACPEDDRRG